MYVSQYLVLNIIKITDVESNHFNGCMRLRDKEFPNWMKEISKVKELIDDGICMLYAVIIDEKIVAFRLIYDADDFVLGDCMAVDESYRNRGIGTAMVKHVVDLTFSSGKRAFFFENYLSENAGDENYARTEFFKKRGAVEILEHRYLPTKPRSGMKLLAFINGTITGNFVMDSVEKIYSFYNVNRHDMLDKLRDEIKDKHYVGNIRL